MMGPVGTSDWYMIGPVGTSDWYMMGPRYQRLVYDGSWVPATSI